ncbi:MAG TPA: cupin domain-containing protein [Gemmatimonadaceae bacterium]|nr:cupin domain-containing protein [Gemmatimonadaceae bacterium]
MSPSSRAQIKVRGYARTPLVLLGFTATLALTAPGLAVAQRPASKDLADKIIALEKSALDRWIRSDPDGYLNIYARDASYFDPFAQKRVDGLDELTAQVAPIRNMKPPFTDIRYEMVNPRVQVSGDVAVLSFNLVDYGKPTGSTQEMTVARWNSTEVYRREKRGGDWRIMHTHWSFTQPQLALAPPAAASQQTSAPSGITRAELLARDLPPGDFRHVQSVIVTLPPGAAAARHRHDVAVFAYVLEGTVENQFNGASVETHTMGESWWETPGTVHDIARNTSPSATARLLIVYIGEDGKTPTVPVR